MPLLPLLLAAITNSYALTLEQYVSEVRQNNHGLHAARLGLEAKKKRQSESALFFHPTFFINTLYSNDKRPVNAPSFQGNQTLMGNYQLGVGQTFRTGSKLSLSYNVRHTEIIGANPVMLPKNSFYDIYPQVEFGQSLWRNFLARENEANEAIQQKQLSLTELADQWRFKEIISRAENAYWRLYFAEKALTVQRESLDRAKKLRDWNHNRYLRNLGDDVDVLQAESNYQAREIELQNATIEWQTASKLFNQYRENESENPVQTTPTIIPTAEKLLQLPLPTKSIREDVQISLANSELATAQATLGEERNRPTFEVFGQYSLYGRDETLNQGVDKSFTTDHPYSSIGLRFVTPIEFFSMNDYKKSYTQEKLAAQIAHNRKAFEVESEWKELSDRFEQFKKRLALSSKMEEVQHKKLMAAKNQYNRGRSTTFQVLQFEQDFANAQLLNLRNELELMSIYNQLKLFAEVQYE